MRQGYDETDVFTATGRAHIMLTAAFSNLPSLSTIGIRDYNAKGRWRDGDNTTWRSYGWSSGEGPSNNRPRLHCMSPEAILPLILHSLDETSTGLERIEVFLRRNRLPDGSFDINPGFIRSKTAPLTWMTCCVAPIAPKDLKTHSTISGTSCDTLLSSSIYA
jgi:hypothetical protein